MDYYLEAKHNKAAIVQSMFDEVAPKYDCFNTILSMGLDRIWRKQAIAHLLDQLPEGPILDMGCGSGDLAGALYKKRPVIAADFCKGMLLEAQKKFSDLKLAQADATKLPLNDNKLSGVITAFVIRNIENLSQAFSEVHRSLKPGGRLVILEFSLPQNPILRFGFFTYLKIMFPIACKLFGGDQEAYQYLRKSIRSFGENIDVPALLKREGFAQVRQKPLLLGGVALTIAEKS